LSDDTAARQGTSSACFRNLAYWFTMLSTIGTKAS